MSDIQDGAPSSTEPLVSTDNAPAVAQPGESSSPLGSQPSSAALGASEQSSGANVSVSPSVPAASTQQLSDDGAQAVVQLGESASTLPVAGQPLDSGSQQSLPSSESSSTPMGDGTDGGEDPNVDASAAAVDSAGGAALSVNRALLEGATLAADASASPSSLMERFETRQYADGVVLRTTGTLPDSSPVSYPSPTAPAIDSPLGILNAIEEYFTTALRSSRTDGHKMIQKLRDHLQGT